MCSRVVVRIWKSLIVIVVMTVVSPAESDSLLSRKEAVAYLREHIDPADAEWIRAATRKLLEDCQLRAEDGTILFTPDTSGHYRALWTRDFQYMVAHGSDLIEPDLVRRAIVFLLRGRRPDGCMPDRVTAAAKPVYAPGGEDHPLADHALDNGAFMAKLVAEYVRTSGDLDFFRRYEHALREGLDFVARAENGLVFNDPARPQCPYGFTDTVAKTGHLLFASLLYYDACRQMHDLAVEASCGKPEVYKQRADLIRENLEVLWDDSSGMFFAADRDCKQIDVWGSALAVDLEIVAPNQRDRIIRYLVAHASDVFKRGQVRHLPAPESWSRLLTPVRPGTYQNGAYWATPHAWVLPALARRRPAFAARLLRETIADFRTNGINECINDGYRNVPDYVASATNTYAILSGSPRD